LKKRIQWVSSKDVEFIETPDDLKLTKEIKKDEIKVIKEKIMNLEMQLHELKMILSEHLNLTIK
jgi:hypothetical protein